MLKQNSNHSEEGFILGLSPYREHDAMVHFLGSKSGLIRLVLPAYYKSGSKQTALGLEYSKVSYRFNPRKGQLNRIIGGEKIDIFINSRTRFDWLINVSIISELLIRYYEESIKDRLYNLLEGSIHEDCSIFDVLHVLKEIIEINGLVPHLNSCVKCSSTGINSFSIENGGFMCNNHTGNKENKKVLLGILALFSNNNLQEHFENEDARRILELLLEYLQYHDDIRLNSWKFYKEMGKI